MKPTVTTLAHRPAVCSDRPTTLQLLIRVEAPKVDQVHRPDLNLGLSLDRSGSMMGEPMMRAKEAAMGLVKTLRPTDLVSGVAFDNLLDVIIPAQLARNPEALAHRFEGIEARGGTNLFGGFLEASHQVKEGLDPQRLSRVILLSDGQTNQGLVDPDLIAHQVERWHKMGVTTTTVGLGLDYNEDLLSAMAQAGGGNFYHVQDSSDIDTLFQVELNGLSNMFGRSVSLKIETLNGVELLRIVNPMELGQGGEMTLADLVHGCPIDIVAELLAPAQESEQDLLRLKLEWTNLESGEVGQMSETFQLPVIPHGQLAEFPVNPLVLQKKNLQLAAGALRQVTHLIDQRNFGQAEVVLKDTLGVLQESEPNPDIQFYQGRLKELLARIRRGETKSVRKEAICTSSSLSIGSFGLSSWIRDFANLPPEERTPQKFQELMQQNLME